MSVGERCTSTGEPHEPGGPAFHRPNYENISVEQQLFWGIISFMNAGIKDIDDHLPVGKAGEGFTDG